MAHIVFVYPDFESLGVEYLMAACRERGHAADLVFYEAEDVYLSRKVDIDYADVARRVLALGPDVAAFSCVSDNYRYQLACAAELKRQRPGLPVVFGGVHPTAVPRNVLAREEVDCVAVGEADESLPELLSRCGGEGGFGLPDAPVPGMLIKKAGEVLDGMADYAPPADLDALPMPDKDPFFHVLGDARAEYRIITSRGCPFACSYCFNSHYAAWRGKKGLRRRTVEHVIRELEQAKAAHPLRNILFLDDVFTMNKAWLREFCAAYRERIGLPFACVTHAASIDAEVAAMLRQAGCNNVQMGIQSLNEELCREVLKRKSSNAVIAAALGHLKGAGIMVQVDHMLGIPRDTVENQEQSLLFYGKHRPDLISIFWLTYYPKTAIIESALEEGILRPEDVARLEDGFRLRDTSYLDGGDFPDAGRYRGLALLMNWLPLLPGGLVPFLVRRRVYRWLNVRSYLWSTALPRVISSLLNPRDFRGRSHLRRFFGKLLGGLRPAAGQRSSAASCGGGDQPQT